MRASILAIVLLLLIGPFLSSAQTFAHDPLSWKADSDLAFALGRNGLDSEMQVLVMSEQPFTPSQIVDLSRFGRVESVTDHVAVLRTYASNVRGIAALGFVDAVEGPRTLSLSLDVSVPELGAVAVREQVNDAKGTSVDGTGVIVGFADTGIDLTHPDFQYADGSSKVLYVWDQSTEGPRSNLVTYGTECTKSEIDAGTCKEYDLNGHGTHVAGIAASTGRATSKYEGVAPGANIIFVKIGGPACDGTSWTASEADIINAFDYILTRARELGRPAVGSLSFGSLTGGGHDDTSAFERALDDIVRDGLPIAASAGNSQSDEAHVSGKISQGESIVSGWESTATGGIIDGYYTEIWYDVRDQLGISVTTPDGQTVQGPTSVSGVSTKSGKVYIVQDETSKGRGWTIFVESTTPQGVPLTGWSFTIIGKVVRSGGQWDGWVDAISCGPGVRFVSGSGYTIDPFKTVGLPGTASEIIAVGSYVTRNKWTSKTGRSITRGGPVGDISGFSSFGPTRDGRTKPDIAAPGEYILSAKSLYPKAVLSLAVDAAGISPDNYHIPLRGTSMAAPHAAGVIALMLQYNPSLTPQKILEILKTGARQDFATGQIDASVGDNTWGWGKIDARTAAGMFRVTLIASGLPVSLKTTVFVDGANRTTLGGARRLDLTFLQGASHTINVTEFVPEKEGVRYRATTPTITLSQTGVVDLKYMKQFLLTINAAGATGGGWYDAGSTATFSVPSEIPVEGLFGTIGGKMRLVQLINEKNQTVNATSIAMDGPHSVTATYVEDLSGAYITLAGIVVAIVAIAVVMILRTRKRSKAA